MSIKNDQYCTAFFDRQPPVYQSLSHKKRVLWHLTAGLTIGLGIWYLSWRWWASLNEEALVFSVVVAAAETLAFLGTLLFFFNIWDEGDTKVVHALNSRSDLGLEGRGDIKVNVFITTYDEDVDLVAYSIDAAKKLTCPDNVGIEIFIADDGNRAAMRSMAKNRNVGYITRGDNRGYKAGNLVNALFHCDADFIVICDADTRVFPNFVERTLGYFRDPKVAFVQTPHWFYDIPEGQSHADWLAEKFGNPTRVLAPLFKFISGREKIGADPFLSGSGMFFDVIQRRRNRHNSSFCCGAGSIHRCEALFENAMEEQGTLLSSVAKKAGVDDASNLLPRIDMQPFRYHVSEDIFTSLQQHTRGWRSVYHPEILAAMLSPWSIDAWAMQKLKYAGGTFDILLRTGLVWRRGLPWQTRLHYLGTFWSYLAVVWMPVLFLAPMISLLTGASPVDAYSIEFFLHLLPLLLVNELAISIGAKGHDIHAGRILSIATMGIQLRALVQVLKGDKFHFQPTPKNPIISSSLRYAMPSMIVLVTMACAATYGVWAHYAGLPNHSASLVVVNFFWLGLNALAFIRVVLAAFWRPRLPNGQLLQLSS